MTLNKDNMSDILQLNEYQISRRYFGMSSSAEQNVCFASWFCALQPLNKASYIETSRVNLGMPGLGLNL